MNKFHIDIDDYEKKNLIGKGAYGTVYKCIKKSNKEEYAAKFISFEDNDDEQKKSINREIKIMSNLIHPTLIKLIGFSIKNDDTYTVQIIMELASNGSLRGILNKCDNTARQIILVGVARGMMFLHQNKVIHFDLKTENILIDKDLKPHISDFSLSRFVKINKKFGDSFDCVGTPTYVAPEVIKGDESSNSKADVYSFGIIMFEIMTGKKPYPNINTYKLMEKVSEENYRPKFPEDFKNESLKRLIC